MSEQDIKEFDCAYEAKAILEYISSFDRDCRYFLKRPSKLSSKVRKILENYIQFAEINNNFIGMKKTDEIKMVKDFDYLEKLSDIQLDELCENIYACIDSANIAGLLDLVP